MINSPCSDIYGHWMVTWKLTCTKHFQMSACNWLKIIIHHRGISESVFLFVCLSWSISFAKKFSLDSKTLRQSLQRNCTERIYGRGILSSL